MNPPNKLYEVEIKFTVHTVASSPEEAERIVENRHHEIMRDFNFYDAAVVAYSPDPKYVRELDSLLYLDDEDEEMTVREFLEDYREKKEQYDILQRNLQLPFDEQ